MEKRHIDRRMEQMRAEGVEFRANAHVGGTGKTGVAAARLLEKFDALVASAGAEHPRDLAVPGRDLDGVHFAMDFLPQQNRLVAGDADVPQLTANGKHVVVIGGGDTGSDCVGTSNRHGALSVTQFELLPQPPEHENKPLVWPYWPVKLRTSSSQEEGCERDWAVADQGVQGRGTASWSHLVACRVEWKDGRRWSRCRAASSRSRPTSCCSRWAFCIRSTAGCSTQLGVEYDARSNVKADTEHYRTSVPKVFAAGDMRRGQSLVVWAIREGRQCARAVDEFLMGASELPR